LSLGYPQEASEIAMLQRLQRRHPIDDLEMVAGAQEVLDCQQAVRAVHADEKVSRYIVQLIQATRDHPDLSLGGSPRASMALLHAAQSFAAVNGFDFVMPDDVKQMFGHVLRHRLIMRPESRLRKKTVSRVLDEVLNAVPVPQVPVTAGAR
jgi:MoxR-like ATPase